MRTAPVVQRLCVAALAAAVAAFPLPATAQGEREDAALPEAGRGDEDIRRDVQQQLAWDTRVPELDIEVAVEDGTVVLRGYVPTFLARQAAGRDAQDIPGVRRVENRLRVDYAPALPADEAIARRVRMILDWVPEIDDASEIEVTVTDGTVYLSGVVDELWKRERIAEVAAIPYGVAEVDNGIGVVPSELPADERIAQQILAALRRTLEADAADVTVTVQAGKVVLEGTVPSWPVWRSARRAALNTRGVVEVDDRLELR